MLKKKPKARRKTMQQSTAEITTKKIMPTKRFSHIMLITPQNLARVPDDKPGVYRIINAANEVLFIGVANGGRLPERIDEHQGETKIGVKFQFRIVPSREDVEKLADKEMDNYVLPKSMRRNK